MSKGLVKSSEVIRKKLLERMKELNLTYTDVCKDAAELGMAITVPSLSKYFSESKRSNLTEEQIIWLTYRYGIFVTLTIGVPKISDGRIVTKIPPYNEPVCLKLLKTIFPNESNKKSTGN